MMFLFLLVEDIGAKFLSYESQIYSVFYFWIQSLICYDIVLVYCSVANHK